MLKEEDIVSQWDNIPDIDELEMERIRNKMQQCKSNIAEVLQVQKYFFRLYFVETTPESTLYLMWKHIDFPRLVSKMIKDKNHIIHRLFDELGVEFGDDFPEQPKTRIDMAEVNKQFLFSHGTIKNTASTVPRMLEAYFKMQVLKENGQSQESKKETTGKRKYQMTEAFDTASGSARKYMKVFNRKVDAEIDLTGGDIAESEVMEETEGVPGVLYCDGI